jgi:hypothetical protein
MVGCALWLAAVAIPAQVRAYDHIFLGERWGDLVPHVMRFGITVKEQQWRTIPPACNVDPRSGSGDASVVKTLKCDVCAHLILAVCPFAFFAGGS